MTPSRTRTGAWPRLSSQQTVRIFILGLPAGLIITGIIAMFVYFRIDKTREQIEARVLVSKALNEADLRSQVRTLATSIGPRHTDAPETLSSARKYIQSTLGPANLGYRVSREEFVKNGQTWHHLVIDLPGKDTKRWDEIVVVAANYDTAPGSPGADASASGVAALMSLAQSFAGASLDRTLRFVVTVHDAPPFAGTEDMGSLEYAATMSRRHEKIIAVVTLEGMGYYTDAANSQKLPTGPSVAYPEQGNFLAIIANPAARSLTESLQPVLAKASSLPLELEFSPSAGPLLGDSLAWAFDHAGFATIRITDTGELRNPHWNQAMDAAEDIDYPKMLEATKAAEALLIALLNPGR